MPEMLAAKSSVVLFLQILSGLNKSSQRNSVIQNRVAHCAWVLGPLKMLLAALIVVIIIIIIG